jgi:hypothetical protein
MDKKNLSSGGVGNGDGDGASEENGTFGEEWRRLFTLLALLCRWKPSKYIVIHILTNILNTFGGANGDSLLQPDEFDENDRRREGGKALDEGTIIGGGVIGI